MLLLLLLLLQQQPQSQVASHRPVELDTQLAEQYEP
jgi:hypothetical protein